MSIYEIKIPDQGGFHMTVGYATGEKTDVETFYKLRYGKKTFINELIIIAITPDDVGALERIIEKLGFQSQKAEVKK